MRPPQQRWSWICRHHTEARQVVALHPFAYRLNCTLNRGAKTHGWPLGCPSYAFRSSFLTDYLSAQDTKPRTTDTSNTPLSSLTSLPHTRKLESESVPSSRQNSARRPEPESYSRQNSSRRPHAVSPWPTPLSARGLSTVPLDGGEAGRNPFQKATHSSTSFLDSP